MSRTAKISLNRLDELTQAWKRGKGALEPDKVKPLLAEALQPMKDQALNNFNAAVQTHDLKPGWTPVSQALRVQEGKSGRIATAFLKLSHKLAPQGLWLEFGHRLVGHKKQGKKDTGQKTPSRPWFRPAVMEKRSEARKTVRVGLARMLAEAVGFGQPGDAGDSE